MAMCIGNTKGKTDYVNALRKVVIKHNNTPEQTRAKEMLRFLKGDDVAFEGEISTEDVEEFTAEDSAKRFELWWRLRSIFERANKEITGAMAMAKEAGDDSEVAKRAKEFAGKLVPQGATLSEIANEPPKMLSKLTTVSSMLFHSEGPPTKSSYAVVDEMEKLIDAEIADWKAFKAKQGK